MKHIYRFLLLPLLSFFMTSCPGPVDTTGSVTGRITDAHTGANLSGVQVSVGSTGYTMTTGEDGRYTFTDVEMGTYTITASKTDYNTDRKDVTISIGETATLDFALRRASSALEVRPLTLDFGENTTTLSVDVKNTGEATMTWQTSENISWLECNPTSGSIRAGQQTSVVVTVNRTGLETGQTSNTIVFTSNDGGSQTVSVTVTVASPDAGLPQVSMIGTSGVTDVAATLNGSLVKVGSSRVTRHGFCWTTDANTPPSLTSGNNCNLGEASEPKDFTYSVTNLTPNTTYYVRAYATNAEGTVYSSRTERFTTSSVRGRPQVETGTASAITSSTATVGANILDLGEASGVIEHGHVWSDREQQPTIDYAHTSLGQRKVTGGYTSSLTNLTPGTTYYVRAYARNNYGISYGDTIQFTTAPGEIQLATSAATGVEHNRATCGGRITNLQGNTVSARGVCWSTSSNPSLTGSYRAASSTSETFSVDITGLQQETTYHVRAYATAATGITYYGQDVQFTTPHEIFLPTVSTTTVSGLTYRSVTFEASVTSNGYGTIRRSGFVFATHRTPTVNDNVLEGGTSTTLKISTSALNQETTYYVRAFAENEKGVAYGPELTVTTKKKPDDSSLDRDDFGDEKDW